MSEDNTSTNERDDSIHLEALARFDECLESARTLEASEPNAMTLATCDLAGRPTARTVLMKHFSTQGLIFFSNERSVKGQQLAANPRGCAVFHWRTLREQVIVEGAVKHLATKASDEYWQSRARESQLAAWASQQSEVLASKDELMARVAEMKDKFRDQPVPRPNHWHGYLLSPDRIEFWRAGWSRLNERDCYVRSEQGWGKHLLNP